MSKHEIESEQWSYKLYQDGQVFSLDVVIGTVGLWEKTIILTAAQVERYQREGKPFIQKLANEISSHNGIRH